MALNLLRPPSSEDAEEVFTRFRREGVTACPINHLNAVAVLDLDVTEGGFPYIVMEYLEGETLEERLRSGRPLTMRQAAEGFADVGACLGAAPAPASCTATSSHRISLSSAREPPRRTAWSSRCSTSASPS